jgi:hypothetical protein
VAGTCDHAALKPDTCLIAGACVARGTLDPSNACKACRPEIATDAYSPITDGTGCADDGNACTVDQCVAGTCDHASPVADGTACAADPFACTRDLCVAGACTHDTLVDGYCFIGPACYRPGAVNPANECEECQPTLDVRAWTPKPNGTVCEGAAQCTENDQCVLGRCVEGPPGSGMACDDGQYCNGADTCDAGACTVHAGTPCTAAQTCNETTDHCMSCTSGPCCSSTGDFKPSSTTCATIPNYWCVCSGWQVQNYYGVQHCSGTASACNGTVSVGSWINTFSCGYGPHTCFTSGSCITIGGYRYCQSCGCN